MTHQNNSATAIVRHRNFVLSDIQPVESLLEMWPYASALARRGHADQEGQRGLATSREPMLRYRQMGDKKYWVEEVEEGHLGPTLSSHLLLLKMRTQKYEAQEIRLGAANNLNARVLRDKPRGVDGLNVHRETALRFDT